MTGGTAIVIVNWNGWRDSIGCIQSCLALEPGGARIILCDNASTDGSVEAIHDWATGRTSIVADPVSPITIPAPRLPRRVAILDRAAAEAGSDGDAAELIIVHTGGNLGFAGGNNVGLRWALAQGADYAWLLNNDTVVPPDALSRLVASSVSDPAIGLAGSTLVEYYEPGTIQAYAGAMNRQTYRGRHLGLGRPLSALTSAMDKDPAKPSELVYPVGASMLATRAFLEQVGLMDEGYFLYYEEADWVLRAEARHFRIALARDSLVYHKGGATAGSTPQGSSSRSVGFLYRSRLRIARQFTPSALPRVTLGILDEAARGLVRGRRSRAIAAARALTGRVTIPTASKSP